MKLDIHNHLGSNGANPGFDETIDLVHSRLGDNSAFGIANSDDFRYENFIEQKGKYERIYLDNGRAVYVPEKKVLVIKTQEMFTKQGHILAIATPYHKNVKSKDAKDAIKEAKDLGAILDAVHPFYFQGIGTFLSANENLLTQFSSYEVYNGTAGLYLPVIFPKGANKKAMDFYFENILVNPELNVGISSATDGHTAEVIGKCYTELPLNHLSIINFKENLDKALRQVKSLENLHKEPNKKDAAIHVAKMILVKLGLRKD